MNEIFFKHFLVVFALLFCVRNAQAQSIIYVNQNATGANNGTSWADAYTDLQAALVGTPIAGTQVWVAAGTYKPTTTTNQAISFHIRNGLALYGGFNGTETLLNQRDWNTNVTVLSGDIGVPNDTTDNSDSLIVVSSPTNYAIFDGFNAEYGAFFSFTSSSSATNKTSAVVKNSKFSHAALSMTNARSFSFTNCDFNNYSAQIWSDSAMFKRCNFHHTVTGLMILYPNYVNIDSCQFYQNSASGVTFCGYDMTPPSVVHINHCDIHDCTYGVRDVGSTNQYVAYHDCTFYISNTEVHHTYCGFAFGASITNRITYINNCKVHDDSIGIYSATTGYPWGPTWIWGTDITTIENTLVYNSATTGIMGIDNEVTIRNSTIVNNKQGASLTKAHLANSIMAFNTLRETASDAWDARKCIMFDTNTPPLATLWSNISSANPLFVNPSAGDYHLSCISPAINAGSNSFVTSSMDLEGNARIQSATVDLGCYEFSSSNFNALNIIGMASLCEGNPLSINVGAGNTCLWTFPNGTTSAANSLNISNVVLADSGIYTLDISSPFGCNVQTPIFVNISPDFSITLNASASVVCGGVPVILTATPSSVTNNSSYDYYWSQNSTNLGFQTWQTNWANPTLSCTSGAPYAITITQGSCSKTVSQGIFQSTITTNFPAGSVVCSGTTTYPITASVSGGTAPHIYSWTSAGNLLAANTNNPNFTYVPPLNYGNTTITNVLTLTVTDKYGCNSTPLNQNYPIKPQAIADAGADVFTCGTTGAVTLTGTASGGVAPYGFNWGPLGSGAIKTVNPSITTVYGLRVASTNGCFTYDTVVVFRNPAPTASATGATLYPGQQTANVSVTASAGTAPYTYTWASGLGNTPTISVSPTVQTTYSVTVSDANNCTASASAVVNISQFPAAISDNGTENSADNVTIFPNPFQEKTTLYYLLLQNSEVKIAVYDANGKLIMKDEPAGTSLKGAYKLEIDSRDWASGIYMLVLKTQQKTQSFKIVKN